MMFPEDDLQKLIYLMVLENAEDDIQQESVYEINDYLTYLFHKDDSIMVATPEMEGRFLLYNYTKEEKQ